MKGFTLQLPFLILIMCVVVTVSVLILLNFLGYNILSMPKFPVDVRYACSNYNNTRISYEKMKTIIYGFLNDQCNNFSATLEQTVTFQDIKKAAEEIDNKVLVIDIDNCKLPSVSSHSVYVCCSNIFASGKSINITRKEIKNSDVLICGDT